MLFTRGLHNPLSSRQTVLMTSRTPAARPVLPSSPFQPIAPPPVEKFDVNDLLTHDRHGLGRVVGVPRENEVHVDFGNAVRRISLPNPKVTRL